jgi:uncharacterized protein YbjT (DUF2867 family)
MSQMTVSQMSIQNSTPSPQQRQHWLGEQALGWSALPVINIRPAAFLDALFLRVVGPAVRDSGRIELPFGKIRGQRRVSVHLGENSEAATFRLARQIFRINTMTKPIMVSTTLIQVEDAMSGRTSGKIGC